MRAEESALRAEPILAKSKDERHDWEIFLELGQRIHAKHVGVEQCMVVETGRHPVRG